jgi:hypothetical protein
MRCVFKVSRGPEWIEERDTIPAPGTEFEYVGAKYKVADAQWWFGGIEDELVLSDALVLLREADAA